MKYNKKETGELSYFRLSLLSYLRDTHPDKAADVQFIALRGDAAAEAYSEAIKSGHTHDQADEIASAVLYAGLHFSPYNTLVNILWDEFSKEIPEDDARAVAQLLLPFCGKVLTEYNLTDDFADTPMYNLLYTELVGFIQIFLEDGLQ